MAFAAEQDGIGIDPARAAAWIAPTAVGSSPCGLRPKISVECVAPRAMPRFQPAWSDLLHRVLEPNVFLDPAFALPLLQHVAREGRPQFLLVWEEDGATSFGRLIGLLPLHLPRANRGLARGFRHPQVVLGGPLLDAERGGEAFAAILAWLACHYPRLSALLLSAIPTDGAFAALLREGPFQPVERLDERQRAIARHEPPTRPDAVVSFLSAKRRKELKRQRRRLGEVGTLAYRSARTPMEVRGATEHFLALEARGWKGRRGAPLLHTPSLATFARTMTCLMAYDGRCRIDSLDLDGTPVAMGILIMAGPRAHFWKTAFDERFAAASPGVQFVLDLTSAQAREPGLTLTDSCAVPDHPMIDRLWADRLNIADLLIPLHPDPRVVARALRRERLRRRCRAVARTLAALARRWRAGH